LWGFLLAKAFGVESLGRAMGLMSSVVTLLNLSTPMLFGLVFDRTGSYDPALTVYIGLLFVAVLLAPRVRTSPTPLAAA
jgi:cyanate permease